MASDLSGNLTREVMFDLVGESYFELGQGYQSGGYVRDPVGYEVPELPSVLLPVILRAQEVCLPMVVPQQQSADAAPCSGENTSQRRS
jgi:hypothetical protein